MVNMFRVKFNVFDFEDQLKISSSIQMSSIAYISPLKSIPPGWGFCVQFSEEEKVYFLLKFGDKIEDWTEVEVVEDDEDDEYDGEEE